jgi:micrococcal nuclease
MNCLVCRVLGIFSFLIFLISVAIGYTSQKTISVQSKFTPHQEKAHVSWVADGDTIKLSDGRLVRYIGINTPEVANPYTKAECFGKEAKKANDKLVGGKNVTLEKDISETDKYGRLLRYVYIDGQMVNELLAQNGYAKIEVIPPDKRYAELFRQNIHEAKQAHRGLWQHCFP